MANMFTEHLILQTADLQCLKYMTSDLTSRQGQEN